MQSSRVYSQHLRLKENSPAMNSTSSTPPPPHLSLPLPWGYVQKASTSYFFTEVVQSHSDDRASIMPALITLLLAKSQSLLCGRGPAPCAEQGCHLGDALPLAGLKDGAAAPHSFLPSSAVLSLGKADPSSPLCVEGSQTSG